MAKSVIAFTLVLFVGGCTNVFLQPQKQHFYDPKDFGVEYEDIYISTPENHVLHAWRLLAKKQRTGLVVFFHGNAENISTHFAGVTWLLEAGWDVLAVDYRGYGRSSGDADIGGSVRDVQYALEWVFEHKQDREAPVILLGQSLGGSLAIIALAGSEEIRGQVDVLVVDSAFSSFRDMSRDALNGSLLTRWLSYPLSYLIDDSRRPAELIREMCELPLIVVHGRADHIVPFDHGKSIYQNACSEKIFIQTDSLHIASFHMLENQKQFLNSLKNMLE